ncbi:MAG: hypothetical protein J6A92_00855 [Lachnospiraceae bacterium]|nr:hypothetical protein [Lachnospiraceae bacterium]
MQAERYIGIDLSEKHAMISYYTRGMSEPGTFSMVTGSEVYQIPVCVAKKKGASQWLIGEEARKYAKDESVSCVEGLFKKALSGEQTEIENEIYDVKDLLFVYLKKLLALPMHVGGTMPDKLVVTTEYMNLETRQLLGLFAEKIQFPTEKLMLLDYRESFYYYALSQSPELCQNQVALYYFSSGKLRYWQLNHDKRTIPQVVTIEETGYDTLLENRDEDFCRIVADSMAGSVISSVYLIGDGFDGGWMKKSLTAICRGRRAFVGKNLFCKGACYGASVKSGEENWQYVYMGDNEIKMNISLKVQNGGKSEWISLITAGENWYEAGKEYEVILKDSPSIDFWIQPPKSREASIQTLELTDMPQRKGRTTRLRISAKPESAEKIRFTIKDLGFGEIVKSSDKIWEYTLSL